MDDADGRATPLTEKDFYDALEARGSVGSINTQKVLEKGKTENEMLQEIVDKVDFLTEKIDGFFGDHVLINGQFKDINDLPPKNKPED